MLDAAQLAGLLAEHDRRQVVAALILQPSDLEGIVAATGISARSAVDALDRLSRAGLVEQGADGTCVVLGEMFKLAARKAAPKPTLDEHASEPLGHQQILAQSIVDGRLVYLPAKRAKRRVVLDRLAQDFEPGIRYPERSVNRILRRYDPDVATLRRYLVDEGFLDRSSGEYWRAGGRFDV